MTENGRTIFDVYADDYDVALARGISVSGEQKDYFAQRRIEWLRDCLQPLSAPVTRLMDFGCGTGSSSPLFFDLLGVEDFVGTDQSPKSLDVARRQHGSERAHFFLFDEYQPRGQFDVVFCNGVFHHIPPLDRAPAIDYVLRSLRAGGLFAFWENNPWNPGTRYVMSRIPFDRDAITLSSSRSSTLASTWRVRHSPNRFFVYLSQNSPLVSPHRTPLLTTPLRCAISSSLPQTFVAGDELGRAGALFYGALDRTFLNPTTRKVTVASRIE